MSDHLRTQFSQDSSSSAIITLYCDYQKQEEQDLDNLIRSVYRQIIECLPKIPESARSLYESERRQPRPPVDVTQLISAFQTTISCSRTVFVVLDALDEASEKVQDSIVNKICHLPFPDVRLFCTSRPSLKFDEYFQDFLQLEIRATDHDLKAFIED